MADTIIYEFTARNAAPADPWDTSPTKMIDGTNTSYAETASGHDEEELTGNEGDGTDLGSISRVELRAYGYGDGGDKVYLKPVFGGADDGDDHTVLVQGAPDWSAWQDITSDPNNPSIEESLTTGDGNEMTLYGGTWRSQTFTVTNAHSIASVSIYGYKEGSSGDVTVGIWATVDSKPSGGDLVSATVLEANLPTDTAWITFSFASPHTLSAATKYAIVVRAPDGTNGANCFVWRQNRNGDYDGGGADYSTNSGVAWNGEIALWDWLFIDQGAWAWSDVQHLDCHVEYDSVSKANTMYCGMVQIQVTYTAEAPPEGVPVQMMHYARMRRAG